MKVRSRGGWGFGTKITLPIVLILCSVFFFAGFYGSILISQILIQNQPRSRILQSIDDDQGEFEVVPHGDTGDSFVSSIPFQVLSWKPRAVYFPGFASAKQCEHIIQIADANLTPSTLALRKGETEENTEGVRTSSGTFIRGSEDKTGILDLIEQKIARATMIPRSHGEAFNILRYEIGQKYLSHFDVFNPEEYGPQDSQRTTLINLNADSDILVVSI